MYKYYQEVSYGSLYNMLKLYKNSSTALFTAHYYLFSFKRFYKGAFVCFK